MSITSFQRLPEKKRQSRDVCRNVEYIHFGMQNMRPSNVKVLFQRPSCDDPYSGSFGFYCR